MHIEVSSRKGILNKWLTVAAMFVALTGLASAAHATYSLPTSRSVVWSGNVGVNGDIPNRSTIYTTLSPSGGDDTTAIRNAISACPSGQVVKLAAGTFKVSNSIDVKSGVTLRGAGMGSTIIKGTSGMTANHLAGFSASYSYGTSYTVTAGYAKGSTTITTSSPHGWSVGDVILIDQVNNASDDPPVTNVGNNGTCTWCGRSSGGRSLGQLVAVTAVPSSTTATIEIPLYWNFDPSLTPQATRIGGMIKNAGIENLTFDNSASGSSYQSNRGTIAVAGASNCWLLNVEAIGSYKMMSSIEAAYRNTIRGCKFHGGVPEAFGSGTQYANSRAYGLWLNTSASANLLENNQFYHLTNGVVMNGATSGNVFGYNYFSSMLYVVSNYQVPAFVFHGAHPTMNLIEGNYSVSQLVDADDVWGSSSHNTFFRNRSGLNPNQTSGTFDMDLQKDNQYYNSIGNVLGTASFETYYQFNNQTLPSKPYGIYRLGYSSDGATTSSGSDPQVINTLLRHGTWDTVTNGVVWNGSNDTTLPASFYRATKPSWWGSVAWPAIGPDVTPMYPTATATGTGTPWGSSKFVSAPVMSAMK